MSRSLFTILIAIIFIMDAHAEPPNTPPRIYECQPSIDSDSNPVVTTRVYEWWVRGNLKSFDVVHEMLDGTLRSRANQYENTSVVVDPIGPDGQSNIIWGGRLKSDPRTRIVGVMVHRLDGNDVYAETWYVLPKWKRIPTIDDHRGYVRTHSVVAKCPHD